MAAKTTCTTTTTTRAGLFSTREAADRAIAGLKAAGYTNDQVGLVYKNAGGSTTKLDGSGVPDTKAPEGAALGAAAGAVGGAAVGAGILAGVIPVIGPVLALGTLGTILANAAGGAAVAGIAGALIGWNVPEEDAKFYEGEVAAGKFLVTVECGTGNDARDVLRRHGSYDRQDPVPLAS